MSERLSAEQMRVFRKVSKTIEEDWRRDTYADNYGAREVEDARKNLKSTRKLYEFLIKNGAALDEEVYHKIMVGLYHYPDFQFGNKPFAVYGFAGRILGYIFFD